MAHTETAITATTASHTIEAAATDVPRLRPRATASATASGIPTTMASMMGSDPSSASTRQEDSERALVWRGAADPRRL